MFYQKLYSRSKLGLSRATPRTKRHDLLYDAYSIWLFTQSDLKTIVIPQTTFGLFCALAMQPEVHLWVRVSGILARLPLMLLVVWINLLPFNIDNQRQPAAILEDKQNKPWRTMPAGRMTGKSAKKLMLRLYVVAFFVSIYVGGIRQCLALMVLGFCYNDLELADWSWSTRNAINGMGFCCFASAALEVALNEPLSMDRHDVIVKWLAMIAGIVFSTVQLQDMPDQQGDKLRGRKTMPLTMGDGTARWLTAMPMLAWSTVCPAYWGLGRGPSVALGGLGLAIALRSLFLRSVDADRTTFCLWNLWMACIYAMPLGAEAARAPVG